MYIRRESEINIKASSNSANQANQIKYKPLHHDHRELTLARVPSNWVLRSATDDTRPSSLSDTSALTYIIIAIIIFMVIEIIIFIFVIMIIIYAD